MSIIERVVAGDVKTAARFIREIEDGNPGARKTLKDLHAHTGNAYVIGVTGAPGVGKSTLVDQMVHHLRKQEKTVGVIAVDPSSPFSGGALLGDRIRMQRHSMDEGVFIRSLATRGHSGGLSMATRAAVTVMDAMGKDYIIIETVGVGQAEIDVVKSAHTTIVVLIPGMGDGVQAVKAGILEAGHIFLVNKADRPGADKTFQDLRLMVDLNQRKYAEENWKPLVRMGEAVFDKGIAELLNDVENHRQHIRAMSAELKYRNKRDRTCFFLSELIKDRLVEGVLKELTGNEAFKLAVDAILDGTKDPYTVCDELLLANLKNLEKNLSSRDTPER
jgi:LAO/AO transport system kinase